MLFRTAIGAWHVVYNAGCSCSTLKPEVPPSLVYTTTDKHHIQEVANDHFWNITRRQVRCTSTQDMHAHTVLSAAMEDKPLVQQLENL